MLRLIRADSRRDLRVDIARGLALFFIFMDHIPGNSWNEWTLRNVAFCDATEVFVLLAGYAAGLSYGAMADRHGTLMAAATIFRRAGTLYVAHMMVFLLVAVQVGYSAAVLNPAYVEEMRLDALGSEPYRALQEALLLRYQPNLLNILPLYVVLLLMLIPALALRTRPGWLLGLSVTLWGVVRLWDINLPSWTEDGWFLNPLAWQLLFFIGCTLGYAPPGGKPLGVPRRPGLLAAAVAYALATAGAMLLFWAVPDLFPSLRAAIARVLALTDKTSLHVLRLLSILALAYITVCWVPRQAHWLRAGVLQPLALMGQQGLPVFCAGIILSFLGRIILEHSDNLLAQSVVNMLGFLAMLTVASITAWYAMAAQARRPAVAPSAAPPSAAVPSAAGSPLHVSGMAQDATLPLLSSASPASALPAAATAPPPSGPGPR